MLLEAIKNCDFHIAAILVKHIIWYYETNGHNHPKIKFFNELNELISEKYKDAGANIVP